MIMQDDRICDEDECGSCGSKKNLHLKIISWETRHDPEESEVICDDCIKMRGEK